MEIFSKPPAAGSRQLPFWLKKSVHSGRTSERTESLLKDLGLHTICESGRCPNRNECYSEKTATFLILGNICTRSCGFCSVPGGSPKAPDPQESEKIAEAVLRLKLRHVVVTSVTRDDLDDEGASQFVSVIRRLKELPSAPTIEVLTPDFRRTQVLAAGKIISAGADIFNHNIETVPSLYAKARPQGDYQTSLRLLDAVKRISGKVLTKSGLMLGLGETREQILEVFGDLRTSGCDFLTVGQYLKPCPDALPVSEFITPDAFSELRQEALKMGFRQVQSGPFVRSSYRAKDSVYILEYNATR